MKVSIEITGKGYGVVVTDGDKEVYRQDNVMESRGRSRSTTKGDIWDTELADEYPDLIEAIDDLSFGPFGIASALYSMEQDHE